MEGEADFLGKDPLWMEWPGVKLRPMANLFATFGDSIFTRENKVQTFISGSIG